MTICGGRDELWPSCAYSAVIDARAAHATALSYADAGHSPVSFGLYAQAGVAVPPRAGGTADSDIAAATDALPRIVAALRAG